jgi:comEA protein
LEPEIRGAGKGPAAACRGRAGSRPRNTSTEGERKMKKSPAILLSLLALVMALVVTPTYADQDKPAKTNSSELLVDINAADIDRLTELPGIGPKVAARIVAYRKDNGPFQKIEEIMNVRGIGEKTFVKLQKHLTVGDKSKKTSSAKNKP